MSVLMWKYRHDGFETGKKIGMPELHIISGSAWDFLEKKIVVNFWNLFRLSYHYVMKFLKYNIKHSELFCKYVVSVKDGEKNNFSS